MLDIILAIAFVAMMLTPAVAIALQREHGRNNGR